MFDAYLGPIPLVSWQDLSVTEESLEVAPFRELFEFAPVAYHEIDATGGRTGYTFAELGNGGQGVEVCSIHFALNLEPFDQTTSTVPSRS